MNRMDALNAAGETAFIEQLNADAAAGMVASALLTVSGGELPADTADALTAAAAAGNRAAAALKSLGLGVVLTGADGAPVPADQSGAWLTRSRVSAILTEAIVARDPAAALARRIAGTADPATMQSLRIALTASADAGRTIVRNVRDAARAGRAAAAIANAAAAVRDGDVRQAMIIALTDELPPDAAERAASAIADAADRRIRDVESRRAERRERQELMRRAARTPGGLSNREQSRLDELNRKYGRT
jgi:hypothetical protein